MTQPKIDPASPEHRFVQHLQERVAQEDRSALAALRRGLGTRPGEAGPALQPFYQGLPYGLSVQAEEDYYLVATLFALWHQGGSPVEGDTQGRDLGSSFARLRQDTGSESVERRFVALLNARREDLGEHLRHAVALLRSRGIPLDWTRLLRDIRRWEWESRAVQRSWARSFWGGVAPEAETGSAPEGPVEDGTGEA